MSNWLASAIQTVREKSVDAIDFVRRDLAEFTSTVKHDTETYINKIKAQEEIDSTSKRPIHAKSDNQDRVSSPPSASFDRVQTELSRIRNDESTYLTDPEPIETYEEWKRTSNFNVDNQKGDIAKILMDSAHVRSIYARLVPSMTTHVDFWARYYFRLHQLEEDEARRTQLLRRVNEICSETNEQTENQGDNDWDEPDEGWTKNSPSNPDQPVDNEKIPDPVATLSAERKGSDTVSGDSWEQEFDDNDSPTSKLETEIVVPPVETVKDESSSTVTVAKKNSNEIDDEWESWS